MRNWKIAPIVAVTAAGPAAAQLSFNYADFSSTAGLTLIGAAAQSGADLRLTPAAEGQAAAVWHTDKVRLDRGFTTRYRFRITSPGGVPDWFGGLGADGLAFVIQNDSGTALGNGGSGMCYEGIPNSLAVEADTWGHPFFGDPDGNHLSIQTMGTAPNTYTPAASLGLTNAIAELTDGQVHEIRVVYDAIADTLKVSFDGVEALSISINLSTLLQLDSGRAWVGFTASTGGAFENHDLLSWEHTGVCYPDCNGCGCLTVAQFGCFQTRFVQQHPYADCNQDGLFTVADFGCFQTEFVAGCGF